MNTTTYETGAVRSSDVDDLRFDLVPPIGLRRVAAACKEGAEKYGDYNWEKGMPVSVMLNHAINHIYKYLEGDRSEDHLGHASWNCLAASHSEELWPELNGDLRGEGCRPPTDGEINAVAVRQSETAETAETAEFDEYWINQLTPGDSVLVHTEPCAVLEAMDDYGYFWVQSHSGRKSYAHKSWLRPIENPPGE